LAELAGFDWLSVMEPRQLPARPQDRAVSLVEQEPIFIRGADNVRLACRVLGDPNARTAILTSGIGCGPVFMTKLACELARDHRVVYWDYRGHGESDPAPRHCGYRIQDHARDLDCVVRTFSPSLHPVMIGFSMGVQVSVEWTRQRPARAAAHVFMLGVPRNPMHRTMVLRKRAARVADGIARGAGPLLNLLQPASRAALRTPLTYLLARSLGVIRQGCPLGEFSDFVRYATAVPFDAYVRCCAGVLEHDGTDAFMRLQEPVLMMAGQHDVFIDFDECRAFASALPNARFEALSCASHAGSIEYGTYVGGRVRAFVESQIKVTNPREAA
jgi:pimeloyl-ACP methyl ester carboxylesterase